MLQENYQEQTELSLKEIIGQYTRYWYWFIITVFLSLLLTYVFLRYTTTLYETQATVIIKDEKSGGGAVELAAFADFGKFFSKFGSNKIENELAVFKSKRIISNVINSLSLNITYESVGAIKTTELYHNKPISVEYLSVLKNKKVPKLYFEILSPTSYKIEIENGTKLGVHNFGEPVILPFGTITVLPELKDTILFKNFFDKKIAVTYKHVEPVALAFQKKTKVLNDIKNSNVVNLSLKSPVPDKAEDFLNELIFQYNKDAINDRSQVAKKTSEFIDSRLAIITKELDSVEENQVRFKSRNKLTDITAEAQLILENTSEFNKRQLDLGTQIELANTMINYLKQSKTTDLLPVNLATEEQIASDIANYNALTLQRNKLLQSSTSKNPVVKNISAQLATIRNNILSGLEATSQKYQIAMEDIRSKSYSLQSKISKIPEKEKIFRDIVRQQSIKEQLYLFLLQQREEASISLAVTAPKAKIVDSAFTGRAPVSPQKPLIYLGAILAGLLLPFLFIYIRALLNNKVSNRRDIERQLPRVPIVGEVPKLKRGHEELIQPNDRSILAESFRILRTNLQYLFVSKSDAKNSSKTILVTSTIKGEGKTFVAFNLALTLALTGKKVVLVGADIRNPQLHRYLPKELRHKKGLTEYIIDNSVTLDDIVSKSQFHPNLSIVLSGVIPPNPAELLMQERTGYCFTELQKKFDYIIVDTAPAMLVTDTVLINNLADITLYLVRAGYTEKELLNFTKDAIKDKRLTNVGIVLNNVSMSNFGYGNKYGYSYSQEKQSFLKRIFKS